MKKILVVALSALLCLGVMAGCGGDNKPADDGQLVKLKVGASPTPHAEILAQVKEDLKAQGVDLEIAEYTDYVQPNLAVESGDLDANFFQHKPYMDNYNQGKGTNLVALIPVHYEPMGLFPGKTATIEELADGASIAVPNDTTNEARALLLLETNGLITLREGAGMNATKLDIVDNPKNLDIQEVEAAQLPRVLQDVDMAVINGNYAVQAGLNVTDNAIAKEESDSLAAETYVNYIVVNGDSYDAEVFDKIAAVMTSDETRQWINDNYNGAVVAYVPAENAEATEAPATEG